MRGKKQAPERTLWIVKQYAVSPDQAGGTRQFDFAKELVKRGWKVVIWASSFSYLEHREMKLASRETWKIEEVEGVRFIWLRSFPYQRNDWRRVVNILHFAWVLYRYGRRLLYQNTIPAPSAIVAFSVPLLTPLAAYFLAKHYKAAFLLEIGDLWPQTLIDMGVLSERNPVTALLRTIEKFLCQRSQRIVVSLPNAQEYLKLLSIEPQKTVYIPNGVDLERFHGTSSKLPTEEFKDNQFTVLYVGAHGPANALDTLLKAAKLLQEWGDLSVYMVLVGDGQEKPRLQKLAQKWRLRNVEFRDSVPRNDVPKLLQEADAAVFTLRDLPLYRYGINLNKLFDYMAAGKPVIFAGHSANNPVEEARCGLTVPPEDPHALAETILKLQSMSLEEREAMGRRGRAYVEAHYDIKLLTGRLERTLEEALASE